ncbi:MAG: LEA type 2 family protein [Alistipes sp.]|nr:LEA type 2 family protein [Alistipes sp.]MBR6662842.1 LEA type 2 family protein [Alistipes sp.]
MRLLRCLLWIVVCCAGLACTPQSLPKIEGVSAVSAEGESSEIPSQIELTLEIDNPTYAAKLCEGQMRINYKGRNVVILTLEEKVRVAARKRQSVELPFRVSVARNSQAAAFRDALRRGDVSEVRLDWRVKVRVAGIKRYEIVQPSEPVEDIFTQQQLEELRSWLGREQNRAQ